MSLRVLHVEDSDLKARSWERMIRTEAWRAGLVAQPADVEVTRAETLVEIPRGRWADVDAVVTDMGFAMFHGQPEMARCGLRVVTMATTREVPLVVISGGERIGWWRDTDLLRWPDHGEERPALQWLMRTVAERRVLLAATPQASEVPC